MFVKSWSLVVNISTKFEVSMQPKKRVSLKKRQKTTINTEKNFDKHLITSDTFKFFQHKKPTYNNHLLKEPTFLSSCSLGSDKNKRPCFRKRLGYWCPINLLLWKFFHCYLLIIPYSHNNIRSIILIVFIDIFATHGAACIAFTPTSNAPTVKTMSATWQLNNVLVT